MKVEQAKALIEKLKQERRSVLDESREKAKAITLRIAELEAANKVALSAARARGRAEMETRKASIAARIAAGETRAAVARDLGMSPARVSELDRKWWSERRRELQKLIHEGHTTKDASEQVGVPMSVAEGVLRHMEDSGIIDPHCRPNLARPTPAP